MHILRVCFTCHLILCCFGLQVINNFTKISLWSLLPLWYIWLSTRFDVAFWSLLTWISWNVCKLSNGIYYHIKSVRSTLPYLRERSIWSWGDFKSYFGLCWRGFSKIQLRFWKFPETLQNLSTQLLVSSENGWFEDCHYFGSISDVHFNFFYNFWPKVKTEISRKSSKSILKSTKLQMDRSRRILIGF